MTNVRVNFEDNEGKWSEIHTMFELTLFSSTAGSKVTTIELGSGLYDCEGTELFEGDKYTYWTNWVREEGGNEWIRGTKTYTLNSISDLYNNPFVAGINCEITGRVDR